MTRSLEVEMPLVKGYRRPATPCWRQFRAFARDVNSDLMLVANIGAILSSALFFAGDVLRGYLLAHPKVSNVWYV